MTNEMTGGEALARALMAHGAGPMFGMGGFQLLPFYDAARRLGLAHHLINDERCGAFAADAYAKVSGRVGLVDATLGPGATNLVTGLVEALNAGSPMVAVVGDTHRGHSWKNMTQETAQAEILRPACKALIRVEVVSRIPELVARAFAVATSGRPGPVVLIVPEDVAHGAHGFAVEDFEADPRYQSAPALRCAPDAESLARAAEMLTAAERPLILAGGGVHLSGAAGALTAFAEAHGVPVAHTMSGKGAIPCAAPLAAGLFGRYDRIANGLIAEADCLLVVGCKLGEIATKRYTVPAPGKRLIHLDIVAEEIGRTYRPTLPLWGDARTGLEALGPLMGPAPAARAGWGAEVARRMAAWRETARPRLESDETPVSMGRLMGALNRRLPADAVLVADGGFAAHWGGAALRPAAGGAGLPARPWLRLDRLRPARRHRGEAGRARPPGGGYHRRRRLQHGAGRVGDGAAARARHHDHRREQRGLGLREGAAASDVWRRRLSVLGPRRDQLRRRGRGAGLPRAAGRASRGAGRRAGDGARGRRPAGGAGCGGDARPRADAAGGRQPRRADQGGGPDCLTRCRSTASPRRARTHAAGLS